MFPSFWQQRNVQDSGGTSKSMLHELIAIVKVLESPNQFSEIQICEHIRRLAEIIVYSEQHNNEGEDAVTNESSRCLEIFFSGNIMRSLCLLFETHQLNPAIQIQILQTLLILAQSIRSTPHYFQFLSQNYLNRVLQYKYFSDEEEDDGGAKTILPEHEEMQAYYVSLLKTLALRLDDDSVQFFFNASTTTLEPFPLFDNAFKLVDSNDSLIRATVRSVCLQVLFRCQQSGQVSTYLLENDFFTRFCYTARKRILRCQMACTEEKVRHDELESMLMDVGDDLGFLADVLSVQPDKANVLLDVVIDPLCQEEGFMHLAHCMLRIPIVASSTRITHRLYPHPLLLRLRDNEGNSVLAVGALLYQLLVQGCVPSRSKTSEYPKELVEVVLHQLIDQQDQFPALVIRLLAKLLVLAAFDTERNLFLVESDYVLLFRAVTLSALRLKKLSMVNSPMIFVECFENEWKKLKANPPLQIDLLLVRPDCYISLPNKESDLQLACQIFLILRLISLQSVDHVLPSLGNADVVSLKENTVFDLKRCKEYFELTCKARTLHLVIVAGALLLVEPQTDICRSVLPIHRVDAKQVKEDSRSIYLTIRSTRRIGLADVLKENEYHMTLCFQSEPKALFARDRIERGCKRARQEKFDLIVSMLDDYDVEKQKMTATTLEENGG